MPFHRAELENGLEIVAECEDDMHTAALGFFVKTGARDETPECSGVSHFLEHMAFKGSQTRSAVEVNRAFDAIGADNNAFTSKESTVYYAALLPRYVPRGLELLADLLRPALRPEDFETERGVILDEILKSFDEPPFNADELCEALHFEGHPLAGNVLGSEQSIRALPLDAMRRYYTRRYGARNIVLAAAGNVDFAALVDLAKRFCGDWSPGETGRVVAPAPRRLGFRCVHKADASQQYVVQMAAAPHGSRKERYAAQLLAVVLGDGTGSRLFWELVDSGDADAASLGYGEFEGAGVFYSFLRCEPEKAQENLRRMRNLFLRTQCHGVTEAELQQAKNKVSSRMVLGSEHASRRMFDLGGLWVHHREYLTLHEELEIVAGVRREEIADVLARYPLTALTAVAIGPVEESAWEEFTFVGGGN